MPIITKETEVKLWGKTVKYYNDLGYEGKHGDIIMVRVEDLTKGSRAIIEILCDCCKKEIINMPYKDYLQRIERNNEIVCKSCFPQKIKERNLLLYGVNSYVKTEEFKEKKKATLLKKYGVDAYTKTKEFREKTKQTMMEKYGVENPFQIEDVKERIRETTLSKYGVDSYTKTEEYKNKTKETSLKRYGVEHYTQTKEYQERSRKTRIEKYGENYGEIIMEKARNTFYEKTGYAHPLQSPEIQEKIKITCNEKYGVDYPLDSPDIRAKAVQTFYKNSSQKVSRQQKYICDLYHGILNYPILYYNADIYLEDDNLVIEYDGGGHLLNVISGRETAKEHKRKEIIRDNVIKREGYKQMRIISSDDKLPTDEILLSMLFKTKQYFSNYPNHSWIEYNIDTSIVRNAEYKDGVFFDFGKLQKINNNKLLGIA